MADTTPPVALAAYAGSAIAKAPPMKTALNATKLAIAAFIVPYIFAMSPAMLFVDTTPFQVVQICITSVIGLFGVAAALNGYLSRPIPLLLRLAMIAGGTSMLSPEPISDVIGLVVIGGIVLLQRVRGRQQAAQGPEL